ncbi:MAG: ABC transporter substrate-binding protein, partial [Planctomycetia bacterium]|nr:ABC transporter substrate-binding protein [Planctomycetia bacterium]
SPKDKPNEPKQIRVYFHSCSAVQYAGFLMAQHEGYYASSGLPPVVFQWLSAQAPDIDVIGEGKAEFAVSWLPHICALRSDTNDFVVISRLAQKQSLKLKTRKDLNPHLTSINTLAGKRLSAPSWAYESSRAYALAFKLGDKLVERNSNGLVLFRDGFVDALFFTSYEGGVLARFSKHRDALRFFSLDTAGFSLPEDVLVCSKRFLTDHRDSRPDRLACAYDCVSLQRGK